MVPGGGDLTIEQYVIEDGTWDLDNLIRDRYNAGMDPKDIGKEIGRTRGYVVQRLESLEKWGEVKHRPGGVWSYGCCSLPRSQRPCRVERPSAVNNTCRRCNHRGEPYDGGKA